MLAGAAIALAGAASTLAANGSLLIKAAVFPFGLLLICYNQYYLFTGNIYKIGKSDNSLSYKVSFLLLNYITNFFGAALVSLVIKIPTETIIQNKISLGFFPLLFLGIACNILVCIGVKSFSKSPLITYICIFFFIACSFEHSIADMYYCICADFNSFWILIPVTLGNIIGGITVILLEE